MRRLQLFSRIFVALLAAALLAALWSTARSATAQAGCATSSDAAVAAITDAHLDQGLESKLLTKVRNAQRQIQSGEPNSLENAVKELDVALHLLDSPATKEIQAAVRDQIRQAIAGFKACLIGPPVVETGSLHVITYLGTPTGEIVEPGPAGVTISIRSVYGAVVAVGVTGDDGRAVFQVHAPDPYLVEACLCPSYSGSAYAILTQPGEVVEVNVVLTPATN